jgi:hypothetical protein
MKRLLFWLVPVLMLLLPRAAAGQGSAPGALQPFVQQVARFWIAGEAGAIAELAPADGRIMLDIGGETGVVQARHAAAALRALFSEGESVSARPTRVTFSGGQPPRGFGELAWAARARGASTPHTRVVYVGAVWEGRGWRLRELRLIP